MKLTDRQELKTVAEVKTILYDLIYDRLANNTKNEQFDPNEYGLEKLELDYERGVITIGYQDKTFEVVVREVL